MSDIACRQCPACRCVTPGSDLAALLLAAIRRRRGTVAKRRHPGRLPEGRVEGRGPHRPLCRRSALAARRHHRGAGRGKDPRIVEVVLRETKRIVKMDNGT